MTVWKPSPNYNGESFRKPVKFFVVHWFGDELTTHTGLQGAYNQFLKPGGTSAHYGVENDTVWQFVKDEHVAWHAGNWIANQQSIGIEHSAGPNRLASEKTYKTSAKLIASLSKKYNLKIDKTTIRSHKEFTPTQCSGTLDLDKLIKYANEEPSIKPMYSMNMDIPTEVEDKYELKDINRYNKYWTFDEFFSDWVELEEDYRGLKQDHKELTKAHSDLKNTLKILREDKKDLQLQIEKQNELIDALSIEAGDIPILEEKIREHEAIETELSRQLGQKTLDYEELQSAYAGLVYSLGIRNEEYTKLDEDFDICKGAKQALEEKALKQDLDLLDLKSDNLILKNQIKNLKIDLFSQLTLKEIIKGIYKKAVKYYE
jgi:hypothetical protein